MERKLAAIFSTDVAGYSRLMGDDEADTIHTLTTYREVITMLIQQHHGRVVDSPGDNLLAEFASAVDALQAAVAIQAELRNRNAELSQQRRMEYRIGLNVGDVVVEGERLYGDGVNIAARLESLAIPGGICISGTVYDQVKSKLALNYEDLGAQTVKNIAEPVRVYRVAVEVPSPLGGEGQGEGVATQAGSSTFEVPRSKSHRLRPAYRWTAGLLLIAAIFITVRYLSLPSPNTQHPTPSTLAASAALPLPDKPSLIVLPFVNMSKDLDQEYFSDGLTEVLTGDLSKISSLFVIARNSAFTYKGKAVKVQDVGREMGVRYVLEGSVQKADQRVRIAAQLIEAATGYHLWSEQYDRPLTDLFALQDEIVQKIVMTLKLQLTLQEQGIIVRKHTNYLEAYDAFLRGLAYFFRNTKEGNAQAQQLYEKAIALDPQYAEAYAYLSWTYPLASRFQWSTDPQMLERGLALAQQAVALDDSLPKAHSVLSFIYTEKKQHELALAEGQRAIALDPNNADSYALQADVLNIALGRPAEALPMIQQAMRLNPHYPFFYLIESGYAYRMTGQYPEAIAALQELISRNPTFLHAYSNLAASYLDQWRAQQNASGQGLEEALAAAQQALSFKDPLDWNYMALGYVYLYQRQYEQALAEIERAMTLAPQEASLYAARAEVLSCMGRTEEALPAAAQALTLSSDSAAEYLAAVGIAYAVAGRYQETVAPLQRYLSHYPDRLGAHLVLAAAYSELGQAAEAQKEAAEVLRINPKFSLEVHKQRMPIKDPAVLERHIAALHKAGLK